MKVRLVDEVHKAVGQVLKSGDLAIDATIGNGHDTEFLVTLGANVIGFDIQDEAILKTQKRLEHRKHLQVVLHKIGHEQMLEVVPDSWIGQVQVVIFNLGYLPGGDKTCMTRAETTLKGLQDAYHVLKKGGYLSVMVYPDHEGGQEEAEAVSAWILGIEGEVRYVNSGSRGPQWYWIRNLMFPKSDRFLKNR